MIRTNQNHYYTVYSYNPGTHSLPHQISLGCFHAESVSYTHLDVYKRQFGYLHKIVFRQLCFYIIEPSAEFQDFAADCMGKHLIILQFNHEMCIRDSFKASICS